MVNFTILAGGFAIPGFIATYNFDSDAGSLSLLKQNPSGDSPSWIVSHPQNSSILYATNELSPVGDLQSFTVGDDGTVTLVDTVSTNGNGPTFSAVLSTGEVTGMNFGSPNASFVPTNPDDPTLFVKDNVNGSDVLSFPVPEGAKSNPHMSLEHNGEVFIPDLGGDKIWRAVRGNDGVFAVQGQINIDPGTGPRHIAILDEILFTVQETASTLTAQRIPEGPNGTTLPLIANLTTVDPKQASVNGTKFAAAEILISTPTDKFPDPLIYVSNRNIGATIIPEGDTIAIYQFSNGTATGSSNSTTAATCSRKKRRHARDLLKRQAQGEGTLILLAQIPTGLQQIRSMALGNVADGGDEFIVAGANTEGGVAIFRRIDGGKSLELVVNNQEIANRTSFVFV